MLEKAIFLPSGDPPVLAGERRLRRPCGQQPGEQGDRGGSGDGDRSKRRGRRDPRSECASANRGALLRRAVTLAVHRSALPSRSAPTARWGRPSPSSARRPASTPHWPSGPDKGSTRARPRARRTSGVRGPECPRAASVRQPRGPGRLPPAGRADSSAGGMPRRNMSLARPRRGHQLALPGISRIVPTNLPTVVVGS
jgi:hypothetical protein